MNQSTYLQKGLSTTEVLNQLKKFGYNEIPEKKEYRGIKILLSQFRSFLIIILIMAGALSIFLGEIIDGFAIFIIVLINATIGFLQEYKAENAVRALKNLVVPTAVALRNGEQKEINIREIVPDDIIILSEGEKIPADLEILESFSLTMDESMLTGESVSVSKSTSTKNDGKLFKGTVITTGRAKAKVISTGLNTEFGKIINLLAQDKKIRSPLAMQLDHLGKKIGLIVIALITLLFIIGTAKGYDWFNMLTTAVALGISAIPEGLPIIVTLTLAIGVQILARKNAIIRKMSAIETLGATTIICSDKTGTLTLNEMTVKKIYTNLKEKDIPGQGYEWKDKIKLTSPEEKILMDICENCNNAFVNKNILGDSTEIALKILNRKAGFSREYKKLDENIFTSERKMMSSLHAIGSKKIIYAKGAFEEIIKKCRFILKNGEKAEITTKEKKDLEKVANNYSSQALRVLAMAYKDYQNKFDENNLIFVGLVGMMDPPRKSVKGSIAIAQKAGIKIKIVTGDNAITASAIGKQIGLNMTKVITGEEIDKMTDKQLTKVISETEIFARTKPEHKYRIVDLLQKAKEVVAVTGDGVNDAPALKHADVGIAMGIKGTQATKEVADIILKDDNFTTIVTTIEEGRRIYQNILAFIKYMLSANYNIIVAVGILTIIGQPLALLPLQILWINIATDALPALALGQSPSPEGIMNEKPHPKKENIFKKFFFFITVAVVIQTAANIISFYYGLSLDSANGINTGNLDSHSYARTIVFTQVVIFELFFAFVCKEEKSVTLKSLASNKKLLGAVFISFILHLAMIYLPFMQQIFKTVPLGLKEWSLIIILGLTAFIMPSVSNLLKKPFHASA